MSKSWKDMRKNVEVREERKERRKLQKLDARQCLDLGTGSPIIAYGILGGLLSRGPRR